MNGEVNSYRLNEPMKWKEFIAMPEDIQRDYINLIRKRFDAPNAALANMFGVHYSHAGRHLKQIGCEETTKRGKRPWDKMGFAEWCYGIPVEKTEESKAEEIPVVEETPVEKTAPVVKEEPVAPVEAKEDSTCAKEVIMAVPESGSMTFEGDASQIMNTLVNLFGNTRVLFSVKWDVLEG